MGRGRTESPRERLQAPCPAVSYSGRGEGFGVKCKVCTPGPVGFGWHRIKG